MNFLTETLKALKVETVSEAIPLIKWVRVTYRKGVEIIHFTLPPNYTVAECAEMLGKLNFQYDEQHCGMKISGTVMMKDGSWLSRHLVVGRECWLHHCTPKFGTAEDKSDILVWLEKQQTESYGDFPAKVIISQDRETGEVNYYWALEDLTDNIKKEYIRLDKVYDFLKHLQD